jgi:Flp pilus assembly protein TadD
MRERLEKMLADGRDNALLRFGLGSACLKAGDAAAAVPHLRRATEHNPAYSAAWKLLGTALLQSGRAEEAEAAWNTGLGVAREQGDMQSTREIPVFLKRLRRLALP